MASTGKASYQTMMTGISEVGELPLEPLIICKLCLSEYPLDKMTTLQDCSCVFCTSCLKQYMQLAIREGCGSPITCPDMVCLNHGTLQEIESVQHARLVPTLHHLLEERANKLKANPNKTRTLCL